MIEPVIERIEFDDGYYEGEVNEEGEMHGRGRYQYNNGDIFIGEFDKDAMHGKGIYRWADGDVYEGEYVDHVQHGYGVLRNSEGVYSGEWRDDKKNRLGTMEYAVGTKYIGEWVDDKRQGQGRFEGIDWYYEGGWVQETRVGKGCLKTANGDVYDGEFKHDVMHGEGTYRWADGATFTGEFTNGLKHGKGCERRPNGDWRAGTWTNNNPDPGQVLHTAKKNDEIPIAEVSDLVENLKLVNAPISYIDSDKAYSPGQDPLTSPSSNTHSNAKTSELSPSHEKRSSRKPEQFVQITDSDLEGWQKVRMIGKGSFGAVYEATLLSGRTVCIKIVELGQIVEREGMEKFKNEIILMKRLNHINIVQYYGSLQDEKANTLNIFMEYVTGGSLNHYLKKFPSLPLETIRGWTYQMVCGVKYLHDQGIVHRDIKGDNILVTMEGVLKLADFGCSKSIDGVCSKTHGCNTMVGTPYWMAPEVIMCDGPGYGMKSDIWSVGCTIVEMITGKPPWPECNSIWAAVYKIANSTGLPTEIPKDLDPELMNFLEKTFERDPGKRASASELMKHPFLCKH
eukprot:Tbor_TRINITY_DN6152_c3_g2::TRINITY_DN6152_c3_g2_i2::g.21460::m.21460